MGAFATPTDAHELTVLFDGHCNLCNAWVRFISRRDARGRFRFRALQSEEGSALLAHRGIKPGYLDSLVLATPARVWVKSDAALIVFGRLGWPWSALSILRVLPRGLRDWVYDRIAAIRYRLFGRTEVCQLS
jgi:predicted DCC family thiol-disulfide oxidoreductase YuxK